MQADTTPMDSAAAPASQAAQALPQGCTNFKLRQLMRRVATHYDAEMAQCGLKTTQYSLLSHVLKLGPIRPGDLAVAMKMDASTLTRNLRPLVDAGWVTLEAGADDVRAEGDTIVVLTEPGACHGIKEIFEKKGLTPLEAEVGMLPELTVEISERDAEQIGKLVSALEEHDDVMNLYTNHEEAAP